MSEPIFAFDSFWLLTLCALLISTHAEQCAETTRVRKPWHHLSDEEQMLYVNAFQRLRREGTLPKYVMAHNKAAKSGMHETSQLFAWHSYWLWEMESDIRSFGGEYECFSLPYWDLTIDAAYWTSTTDPQIDELPIYNSNLGGEGNVDNDMCVETAPWSLEYYSTDTLCADDEEDDLCCLKRLHTDGTGSLYTRSDFGETCYSQDTRNFTDYLTTISAMHGQIHLFIGAPAGTHFHPTGGNNVEGEPIEEPLFALFHAFIVYIQSMRADCAQYDLVNAEDLDDYDPWAFTEYGGTDLDYAMDFSILCEDPDGTTRFCSDHDVTPRVMFDMSSNTNWDVVYQLGDFWHQNEELQAVCGDALNGTWWRDEHDLFVDSVQSTVLPKEDGFENRTFMICAAAVLLVLLRCVLWCLPKAKDNGADAETDPLINVAVN